MIFRDVLGGDFDRLHPALQRRFGIALGQACIGRGVMDEVWRSRAPVGPFLVLGTRRHILFPETGQHVRFTIENYTYVDRYARPTVTFVRTFDVRRDRSRRFDATMVLDADRGVVVDFLGTHQHVAVDLDIRVDEHGGLRIRSTRQWLQEGRLGFRFPRALSGSAELSEWYDDVEGVYRIDVAVVNPLLGPLFGYRGWFQCEFITANADQVPAHVRPVHENPWHGRRRVRATAPV